MKTQRTGGQGHSRSHPCASSGEHWHSAPTPGTPRRPWEANFFLDRLRPWNNPLAGFVRGGGNGAQSLSPALDLPALTAEGGARGCRVPDNSSNLRKATWHRDVGELRMKSKLIVKICGKY